MNYIIAIIMFIFVYYISYDGSPKENGSVLWFYLFLIVVAIGGIIYTVYKKKRFK